MNSNIEVTYTLDYSNIDIYFNTTFGDLVEKLQGNGEKLPIEVVFRKWPNEDSWIEPGMRALLVGIVDDKTFVGDESFVRAFFYFGMHEEYNIPFFKKEYDHEGKLVDAIEAGCYDKREDCLFPKDKKVQEHLKFFK